MTDRGTRWRVLAAAGTVLVGVGLFAHPGAELVQDTLATQTDQLQFDAKFQTDKPFEVTGQWAQASIQTDRDAAPYILESPHSPQPQSGTEETYSTTTLCVDGGGESSCTTVPTDGPTRSSVATTSGKSEPVKWSAGLAPDVTIQTTQDIETEARCEAAEDGSISLYAAPPSGVITTSGDGLLLGGEDEFNVGATSNGEMTSEDYSYGLNIILIGLLYSYARVEVLPRWGTDHGNHTAFSEVEVRYRAASSALGLLGADLITDGTKLVTYTVRSECGLTANDGSGVTGPAARPARVADPMGLMEAPPADQTTVTSMAAEVPSIAVDDSALVAEYSVTVPDATFPFVVRAERDLSPAELDLVTDALTDVALSQNTTSGELPGIRWEIHSADGVFQLVPRVAMELDDGTVIVASPDLSAMTTTTTTPTTQETTPATETTTTPESEPIREPAPEPTPTTAASTTAVQ